jgi:transcriptional repressor NrdR
MRCPFCGNPKDRVVDSRAAEEGAAIRRRRVCQACEERFTTYEHVERNAHLSVIKRDGTRVPFDRNKVFEGLEKACYKRSVSADTLQGLAEEVEEALIQSGEREVEALRIGRLAAEKLRRVDQVAYVRFASVYKQFREVHDFLREVQEVLETREDEGSGQETLF